MATIARTRLIIGKGFDTQLFEAIETAGMYRINDGQDTYRKQVKKSDMMFATVDVTISQQTIASIWHLPNQAVEAMDALVKVCRLRIDIARETAARINKISDAGEKFLESL